MDWNALIMSLLGGTTLASLVTGIVYYRENKKLKKNEVKHSDVETQKSEIELGELYQKKMLELIETVSSKQDTSAANQQKMLDKIDRLDEREDKAERQLANIVAYLNGDYQSFLNRQYGK